MLQDVTFGAGDWAEAILLVDVDPAFDLEEEVESTATSATNYLPSRFNGAVQRTDYLTSLMFSRTHGPQCACV